MFFNKGFELLISSGICEAHLVRDLTKYNNAVACEKGDMCERVTFLGDTFNPVDLKCLCAEFELDRAVPFCCGHVWMPARCSSNYSGGKPCPLGRDT